MALPITSFAGRSSPVRITIDPKEAKNSSTDQRKFGRRVLWFVVIYTASVIAFAAISGLLSMLLPK